MNDIDGASEQSSFTGDEALVYLLSFQPKSVFTLAIRGPNLYEALKLLCDLVTAKGREVMVVTQQYTATP
jgi:hypothetical protein